MRVYSRMLLAIQPASRRRRSACGSATCARSCARHGSSTRSWSEAPSASGSGCSPSAWRCASCCAARGARRAPPRDGPTRPGAVDQLRPAPGRFRDPRRLPPGGARGARRVALGRGHGRPRAPVGHDRRLVATPAAAGRGQRAGGECLLRRSAGPLEGRTGCLELGGRPPTGSPRRRGPRSASRRAPRPRSRPRRRSR